MLRLRLLGPLSKTRTCELRSAHARTPSKRHTPSSKVCRVEIEGTMIKINKVAGTLIAAGAL